MPRSTSKTNKTRLWCISTANKLNDGFIPTNQKLVITVCSLFHIVMSHFLLGLSSVIHITSACLLCSKIISRNRCSQRPFQTSGRPLQVRKLSRKQTFVSCYLSGSKLATPNNKRSTKVPPCVDLVVSQGQQTEPALQERRFMQTGKRDFHLQSGKKLEFRAQNSAA